MRRSNLTLCLLMPFLAAGAAGCGQATGDPQWADNERPIPVSTLQPGHETVRQSLRVVGHVRAWEEVILHSKVTGYLDWIGVDRGSWAKPGEVIARVDDPETRRDLERFLADTEAKKQMYDRLQRTREQNPDMVRQLDIDRARGEYEAALAAQRRAEQLCSYAEITAPFSGVVTQRWVDRGALIQNGTSSRIVRMMLIDSLRVVVEVPEEDSHKIRKGQNAHVWVKDLSPDPFEGHVARYSWAVEPTTRTMTVEIDLKNADHRILPGAYVAVEIVFEERPNTVVVPNTAIEVANGRSYVWTVAEGRAARIPVQVGRDDGITSEIREGLSGLEHIVVAGRERLRDGITVSNVPISQAN